MESSAGSTERFTQHAAIGPCRGHPRSSLVAGQMETRVAPLRGHGGRHCNAPSLPFPLTAFLAPLQMTASDLP